MSRSLLLLLIALGILGCGARGEVAKERVFEQIDSYLGEMDVKRKQIQISMNALNEGVKGIRKAKIKAQVKSDQIGHQIAALDQRIAATDTTLQRVREHLTSAGPVEIAGHTYDQQELNEMANKVIDARKALTSQRDSLANPQESLGKVAASLERKQADYQNKLTRLESQIAEIDAKLIALNAMKDAAKSMDETDASLAENVEQLQDRVNDLYADVEVELRMEDEQWDERNTIASIDSVDAFIAATQDASTTLDQIDELLGQ